MDIHSAACYPETLPVEGNLCRRVVPLPLEDSSDELDRVGPVFVMGCPRSGTTVLADWLDCLPAVLMKIGILAPDRLMHLFGSGTLSPDVAEHLLWNQRVIFWRAFLEMHASRLTTIRDALRKKSWATLWRRERPVDGYYFAYKEPFLIFGWEAMAAHFVNAKFIHIIRNGLDCADSMARTYPHALQDAILRDPHLCRLKGSEIGISRPWGDWNVPWWVPSGAEDEFLRSEPFVRYVWMWRIMTEQGMKAGPALEPHRYLELRYEDLCRDPSAQADRVLQFLGLSGSWAFRSMLRNFSVKSIDCYHRQTSPLVQAAKSAGQPLLHQLGYI